MGENIRTIIDRAPELIIIYGTKVLMAVVVFVVGKFLVTWIAKALVRGMTLEGVDPAVATLFVSGNAWRPKLWAEPTLPDTPSYIDVS